MQYKSVGYDADERKLCLILLDSIGDGVRWLLPLSDKFDRQYALLSYVSYQSIADCEVFSQDQIDRCDVLICHPLGDAPFTDGARYADFLRRFPAATRKIFVASPRFDAFWPFYIRHGTPLPLPLYQPFWPHYTAELDNSDPEHASTVRGEAVTYPFGDRYLAAKLQEGLPPAQVASAYLNLDIDSVVDLDLQASQALAALERNEQTADVKCAAMAARFRERKMFVAPDLAANHLLLHITNEILTLLALPPLPESVLMQLQRLIKIEAPIHPSVGRFFGIAYAGPDTRYMVDRHRLLTFAEYVHGYVAQLAAGQRPDTYGFGGD